MRVKLLSVVLLIAPVAVSRAQVSSCDPGVANPPAAWYSYTAETTGLLLLDTCGSGVDTVLSVFDSTGLTELACNDNCSGSPCGGTDSCLSLNFNPGESYLIRVAGKGGAAGEYALTTTLPKRPPNDVCLMAVPVAAGTTQGTMRFAESGDSGVSCAETGAFPDVWYTWTASASGNLFVRVCSPGVDSVLGIYGGGCGHLSELVCNDDCIRSNCTTPASCAVVPVQEDATYLIRVMSKVAEGTEFTLALGRCGRDKPAADADGDDDVDQADFGAFQACLTEFGGSITPGCECFDLDGNSLVETLDFARFSACMRGADVPADPACLP